MGEENQRFKFVQGLVEIFKRPDIVELLAKTRAEIPIVKHYSSSMGAIMTESPPDYEVLVTNDGLVVRRDGRINEGPFPADVRTWFRVVPHGSEFHDSSRGGDNKWAPNRPEYLANLEKSLEKIREQYKGAQQSTII